MKKLYLFLMILIITQKASSNPVEFINLEKNDAILLHINHEGNLKKALKYHDLNGDHVILISQKEGSSPSRPDANSRIEFHQIYAYSYIINSSIKLEWLIKDSIDCPGLDSEMGFFESKILLDDADDDGLAEFYFPYHSFCGGGVDPKSLKIIMRSGDLKLAARGESKIVISGSPPYGGDLKLDSNLQLNKNKKFKKNIMKIWNAIVIDKRD
jgi:hypothetical protein